jgi:ATP-dependent Zn protease
MIDGYNTTVGWWGVWVSPWNSIATNQIFSYVAAASYNGKPSAQYDIITAQTITNSIMTSSTASSYASTETSMNLSIQATIFGLSVIALPFIAVFALVFFLVRRRRTRTKGVVGRQAPLTASVTGIKYCTNFCVRCGARQN